MRPPGHPEDEWERETDLADAPEGEPLGAPGARALLVCRQAAGTSVVEIGGGEQAIVGRGADATLHLDDAKASRRHFAVRVSDRGLVVEDLDSRNGTSVNGQLLRGASIAVTGGCIVSVGDAEIVIAAVSSSAGAPAPPGDARLPPGAREDESERGGDDWVVADAQMERVVDLARKVAGSTSTVLILGETGAGKDVLARRIHAMSPRRSAPFVRVNCGALPEALLESELFGFEKGAFTGADRRKIGLVEAATGGTLFIDEVGELSPAAQVKLLHVLENRTVIRVGGTGEVPIDIRVICATHRDLAAEAKRGTFRADLFYRISPFVLTLPPLRGRPAAILALAHSFAAAFARAAGDPRPTFSREVSDVLASYAWPGNARELRNALEHAMLMAEGEPLGPGHLPAQIVPSAPHAAAGTGVQAELAQLERRRIEDALRETNGNRTRAAELLGMPRRTLVYKLARWRQEG
jgi:two-component system, NtrC family, response regulator AtoC